MADTATVVLVPGRHAAALAGVPPVPGVLVSRPPGTPPAGGWPSTDGQRRPAAGRVVCCVLDPAPKPPLDAVWPRWARARDVPLVVALEAHGPAARAGLVACADVTVRVPRAATAAHLVSRVLTAARGAAAGCPHPVRTGRRIGIVTPWPPDRAGPASSMHSLVGALPPGIDVQIVAPRTGRVAADVEGWDATICSLGDSPFHVPAWEALMKRGGDLLLHDARLGNLYETLLHRRAISPAAYRAALLRHEASRIPPALRRDLPAPVPVATADRLGLTFLGDVVGRAGRILVHSAAARDAVVAVRPDRARDVRVVVHGGPPVRDAGRRRDPGLVVGFGHPRDPEAVLTAFARARGRHPTARLVLAGDAGPAARRMERLARRLGVADAVTLAGWVSDDAWNELLDTAAVALQVRGADRGESSQTIAQCMAVGLPVIATAVGGVAELPGDALVLLPAGASGAELGRALADLLGDPARRAALATAGRAYRAHRRPADAARSLVEAVSA